MHKYDTPILLTLAASDIDCHCSICTRSPPISSSSHRFQRGVRFLQWAPTLLECTGFLFCFFETPFFVFVFVFTDLTIETTNGQQKGRKNYLLNLYAANGRARYIRHGRRTYGTNSLLHQRR